MFLEPLIRRNPALISAAIALHQEGRIPANTYVIDTDTVEANARAIAKAAAKSNLKVFAMTKQMGRNATFCAAVMRGGIGNAVAVDVECARACSRAGMKIGHIGHLMQIARAEASVAASFKPDYWTVFSEIKAREAATASQASGHRPGLLARIFADGDTFYTGHEGGFPADEIVAIADRLDRLQGARFAGITTFPAQLFDPLTRKILPTPNLSTLRRAANALAKAGRKDIEINAPGSTSSAVLEALAEAGATQCEPGHGLTGTTPLHALEDLPELPAVAYVSEVSHYYQQRAYCFGGGLYIDPIFPAYDVNAVVTSKPDFSRSDLRSVEIPPPEAIDYYGMIDAAQGAKPETGDTVVFGFRPQIFVTRSFVAGISRLRSGQPKVEGIYDAFGRVTNWPNG